MLPFRQLISFKFLFKKKKKLIKIKDVNTIK